MNRNIWLKSCLTIIGCLLLSACAKAVPIEFQDRTLLDGEPCLAPCWYGIEIGVDNQESIRQKVVGLSFLDPDIESIAGLGFSETPDEVVSATSIRYGCRHRTTLQWCVNFILVDDQLRQIRVYPNYELSIEELVQSLGPPDYISAREMGIERVFCTINLVWQEKQILAIHYNNTFRSTRMCNDLQAGANIDTKLSIDVVLYVSEQRVEREIIYPWPN
ncbi:MAG: hypothetical protein KIS80_01795 [Anaerolineales bacterium]|nr:hypothetical protein [Anaerolineales bacterium]